MADDNDDDDFVLEETHHPDITDEFTGEHGKRFAVFVQWKAGESHHYEETVVSSDPELALSQARETIERRWDPESVWIVAHEDVMRRDNPKQLAPSTDREYRSTAYYAQNMEMPDIAADDDEVFG